MAAIHFSTNKLRGKIIEKYGTMTAFSDALGITRANFSNKMRGKTYFSVQDIYAIKGLLNLEDSEIGEYFFTPTKA